MSTVTKNYQQELQDIIDEDMWNTIFPCIKSSDISLKWLMSRNIFEQLFITDDVKSQTIYPYTAFCALYSMSTYIACASWAYPQITSGAITHKLMSFLIIPLESIYIQMTRGKAYPPMSVILYSDDSIYHENYAEVKSQLLDKFIPQLKNHGGFERDLTDRHIFCIRCGELNESFNGPFVIASKSNLPVLWKTSVRVNEYHNICGDCRSFHTIYHHFVNLTRGKVPNPYIVSRQKYKTTQKVTLKTRRMGYSFLEERGLLSKYPLLFRSCNTSLFRSPLDQDIQITGEMWVESEIMDAGITPDPSYDCLLGQGSLGPVWLIRPRFFSLEFLPRGVYYEQDDYKTMSFSYPFGNVSCENIYFEKILEFTFDRGMHVFRDSKPTLIKRKACSNWRNYFLGEPVTEEWSKDGRYMKLVRKVQAENEHTTPI